MMRSLRPLSPLLLLMAVAGCAGFAPPLTPDMPGRIATYRLNAGDRLRVTVFNEPALSNEFAVSGEGQISFPLVGNIPVGGKSVEEAQALLQSSLANGYVRDPKVTLEVVNFRPYYMLGEIGKPGQYPYQTGLTVTQAVAVAGGFSYRANQKRIFVKRADDTVERQIDVSRNTAYVLPGDTIRIGERYF